MYRKLVLVLFALTVFGMILFPPFHYSRSGVPVALGYRFIGQQGLQVKGPPATINVGMLGLQIVGASIVFACVYFVIPIGPARLDWSPSRVLKNSPQEQLPAKPDPRPEAVANDQVSRRFCFIVSGLLGGLGLAIFLVEFSHLVAVVLLLLAGGVWNIGLQFGRSTFRRWVRVLSMILLVWVSAAIFQVKLEDFGWVGENYRFGTYSNRAR